MTDRAPEYEALTWAICASNQGGGPGKCDPWRHCVCGGEAAAVIVALRMSGWVITPKPIGAKLLAAAHGECADKEQKDG